MLIPTWLLALLFLIPASSFTFAQRQETNVPERDPQSVEILARVVQVSGGPQVFAAVRDITEQGEITFDRGGGIKGPLTIQMLGANHFRLEADLQEGKRVWVVRNGIGSQSNDGNTLPMVQVEAANFANLTYPLAEVFAVLSDSTTAVTFVGIEKKESRSLYRIRVKGQLGVGSQDEVGPITKDLLIDALNFNIVCVEDHPSPTHRIPSRKSLDTTTREVDFTDFRTVNGILIPFSIITRVHGQELFEIILSKVLLNSNIEDGQFSREVISNGPR